MLIKNFTTPVLSTPFLSKWCTLSKDFREPLAKIPYTPPPRYVYSGWKPPQQMKVPLVVLYLHTVTNLVRIIHYLQNRQKMKLLPELLLSWCLSRLKVTKMLHGKHYFTLSRTLADLRALISSSVDQNLFYILNLSSSFPSLNCFNSHAQGIISSK